MPKIIKQNLYKNGGSRIYTETENGGRDLLVDTFHTEKFAIAVKEFVEKWLKENQETKTANGAADNSAKHR